ncbi:MAG: DUF3467 domain-containing protein [Candidatus Aminicenantes bacterium]|nr:DUF3467 domain-containing protein [Candidatus Aminicenantes bacterium]
MSEIPFYYSNIVGIVMSQNDITLDFGYKSPEHSKEGPEKFEIKARVSMSPSHAKHMLLILKDLIDKYEGAIGEIPLEKDKKAQYDEMFKK